ncbi:glycosyltransferase [Pseudoxanthomonas suwonensis]|uniref:glycosyltransferase n=1 Tax=Pseudoxanthomonas suwonensis TaxID=314722 RepID=UPI00130D6617|nr:glycosyltransferase [Pseudoxanthomonas suwonensis]
MIIDQMADISIVVPVLNDEKGLLFTLSSIESAAAFAESLVVEVIVIDGNGKSSERLVDALRLWPHLRIRQEEDPARGAYAAVDRGLAVASGPIQGWLNAGDYIFPQALYVVGLVFDSYARIDWVCGHSALMSETGLIGKIDSWPVYYPSRFISAGLYQKNGLGYLQQEGMFWRRTLYSQARGLDLSLKLAADFDLWKRFSNISSLATIATPIAAFEVSPSTQRSRIFESEYLAEVSSRTSQRPWSLIFKFLGSIGYSLVVLLRFLFFSAGTVIFVDVERGKLVPIVGLWPAARVSLWGLISTIRIDKARNHAQKG